MIHELVEEIEMDVTKIDISIAYAKLCKACTVAASAAQACEEAAEVYNQLYKAHTEAGRG